MKINGAAVLVVAFVGISVALSVMSFVKMNEQERLWQQSPELSARRQEVVSKLTPAFAGWVTAQSHATRDSTEWVIEKILGEKPHFGSGWLAGSSYNCSASWVKAEFNRRTAKVQCRPFTGKG